LEAAVDVVLGLASSVSAFATSESSLKAESSCKKQVKMEKIRQRSLTTHVQIQ
jgi:hypothetical protein